MNFLAHHAVALSGATDGANEPDPAFYVGNVLPDLISASGIPRIRPEYLIHRDSPLSNGMRLHVETDRHFHGLAEFAVAQGVAKRLLLTAPFADPPKRTFFLAHVIVEIALDRYLMRADPNLCPDFYSRFARADLTAIVEEVAAILQISEPPSALTDVLTRFARHRYLYEYTESLGCAEALDKICRRAGVIGFPTPESRSILAGVFDNIVPTVAQSAHSLLTDDSRRQSMVQ